MFASHEVRLGISFIRARACLTELGQAGWLDGPSQQAYAAGLNELIAMLPRAAIPGPSGRVRVQLLDPVPRGDGVVLPLRWEATGWEATGAASRRFPVLDADLVLTPGSTGCSMLALTGAYRPPLGARDSPVDRALVGRAAAVTVRSLLSQVADLMLAGENPGRAAVGPG